MNGSTGVGTVDVDDDGVETAPAEDFGFRVGVGLALLLLALAVVGPDRAIQVGNEEVPVVLALVEPFSGRFLLYLAGTTAAVSFGATLVYPTRVDEAESGDEWDLLVGLVLPVAGLALVIVGLGSLGPAVYYAATGELARAGAALVGLLVIGAMLWANLVFRRLVLIGVAAAAVPVWLPAALGVGVGSLLRRLAARHAA